MEQYAIAFAVTFTSVFLKGIQHKNVQHDMIALIGLTSFCMAALDFAIIKFIAGTTTWTMVFACGAGGAVGMMGAVVTHKRLMLRKKKNDGAPVAG